MKKFWADTSFLFEHLVKVYLMADFVFVLKKWTNYIRNKKYWFKIEHLNFLSLFVEFHSK